MLRAKTVVAAAIAVSVLTMWDAAQAHAGTGDKGDVHTDHDQTLKTWGFQVTQSYSLVTSAASEASEDMGVPGDDMTPTATPLALTHTVGVRHWTSRTRGWEAGAVVHVERDGVADVTSLGFGGQAGLLWTLGIYKHMVVFAEPSLGLLILVPHGENVGYLAEGRFSVGTEVRLGMLGLPRLGLTARISAAIALTDDGNETSFFLGTDGGVATSVRGLIDTSIGFVFYM